MSDNVPPAMIWQTETTAAGTAPDGRPWQAQLIPSSSGVNVRVTLPDGSMETTNHIDATTAAAAAEWTLARAGAVQKPVELLLTELLLTPA